jgi:hypothetical protein
MARGSCHERLPTPANPQRGLRLGHVRRATLRALSSSEDSWEGSVGVGPMAISGGASPPRATQGEQVSLFENAMTALTLTVWAYVLFWEGVELVQRWRR